MTTYIRFFDYDAAFDHYCELIDKMKQGNNAKSRSRIIAKPALILAIIKLIEDGKTANKFTYEELEPVYRSIFGQYFIEARQENLTPLCYPYYYMKTDKFWHLTWTNAETSTSAPTPSWIDRNTKYAYIDKELWILLSHEPYRNRMREYIVEEKMQKARKDKVDRGASSLKMIMMQLLMVV